MADELDAGGELGEDVAPSAPSVYAGSASLLDTDLTSQLFPRIGGRAREFLFYLDLYSTCVVGCVFVAISSLMLNVFVRTDISCSTITSALVVYLIIGIMALLRGGWYVFSLNTTCSRARIAMHNQVDASKVVTLVYGILVFAVCVLIISTSPSNECLTSSAAAQCIVPEFRHSLVLMTGLVALPLFVLTIAILICYDWQRIYHLIRRREAASSFLS